MIKPELFSDREVEKLEDRYLCDECRFCGCDERPYVENKGKTFIDRVECNIWAQGPFRVHCDKCGTNGPERSDPEKAIWAWNSMPKTSGKTRRRMKK